MSIKTKITYLFIVSLLIMMALGLWSMKSAHEKNEQILLAGYKSAAKELFAPFMESNIKLFEKRAKKRGLRIVDPALLNDAQTIYRQKLLFGSLEIVQKDHKYYLLLQFMNKRAALYDPLQEAFIQERWTLVIFILLDIALLLLIYLFTLKLIAPIQEVAKKMERFAKEGAFEPIKAPKERELQSMAQSFNEMAITIKEQIAQRENLLKFIGHELKTPLAKAKFALEKGDSATLGEALSQIERLTKRTLELHLIDTQSLKREPLDIETLLVEALQRCAIEDERAIEIDTSRFEIEADKELLAIALKNLIENALKYATAYPIRIVAKPNFIQIINYGEPLVTKSFGLGLTLTHTILQKHGYTLQYEHKEGKNNFTISL
ncbi:MAG: HAMP domain-containing histidine kinase [Epsilonproteobacteria bacterium]|nr:HAMP domain-containing histidine kinase [Campylobacterota bacterium]